MLEGRTEEIILLAKAVHKERLAEGREDDGLADYYAAETLLIQETFQRQLGCTISLLSAQRVRHATSKFIQLGESGMVALVVVLSIPPTKSIKYPFRANQYLSRVRSHPFQGMVPSRFMHQLIIRGGP